MENTSQIASIAYDIETFLYEGLTLDEIIKEIKYLKDNDQFPKNLELIDAYLGEEGTSGCAFLDINTGEVVVGFAGTNKEPGDSEFGKDVAADITIGVNGLTPDGEYLKEANEFIKGLEDYNVTQVTGHSLGGAISVLVGANNNIPTVITYNGAPIYVTAGSSIIFNNEENQWYYSKVLEEQTSTTEFMENYNGKIIRFVSSNDQLNNGVNLVNGYYAGEKIVFLNSKEHDMKFFLDEEEQKIIKDVIELELGTWKEGEDLTVDFNGDKTADIALDIRKIPVKNLLQSSGNFFKGGNIKISPESLKNLANNLKVMVNDDINWIKNAINKCIEKNNDIKANKDIREYSLYDQILAELNSAKLTQLLYAIDDSHGKLSSKYNIGVIDSFANMDTYSITRKFDGWGSSGARTWYLGSERCDISDINSSIKKLQRTSTTLKRELTKSSVIEYYNSYPPYKKVTLKIDTISKIGDDFVNVTNSFISKAENVFEGTGLRSGKSDGIVNALEEVLSIELKNIEEIGQVISNISDMAEAISMNFENVDSEIGKFIESGSSSKYLQTGNMPATYNAYLEENNILDDVKDIIEAFDIQVEEASRTLAKDVIASYEPLIDRTYKVFSNIIESFEEFNDVVEELEKKLNSEIKSEKYEMVSPAILGQYEKKEYYHGTLASNLPAGISTNISHAKNNIKPLLENFYVAMTVSKVFKNNINITRNYFKRIIERAVYSSMDLSAINKTQGLIAIIIGRMKTEINQVSNQLLENYEGQTFKNYSEQLNKATKLLEYFELMLEDCYGVNI